MSDMGELYGAYRAVRAQKRRENTAASTAMLREAGVEFESKNGGTHLIVMGKIDFWPGTGLWIERGTDRRRRGVRGVLAWAAGQKKKRA